jgi:hypothetical protein
MLNDRFKTIPGLKDPDASGAGGGNRTRIASLEGWSFTTKLRPLNFFLLSLSQKPSKSLQTVRGGGSWIRTNVGKANGFTARPL